jgi:hypothetical protein
VHGQVLLKVETESVGGNKWRGKNVGLSKKEGESNQARGKLQTYAVVADQR